MGDKKKMSLYYDIEKDKDLIAFIDDQRGSISRNAYILTLLYGIKNNVKYTPIRSIKQDTKIEEPKQEIKNSIKKENKSLFKSKLKSTAGQ